MAGGERDEEAEGDVSGLSATRAAGEGHRSVKFIERASRAGEKTHPSNCEPHAAAMPVEEPDTGFLFQRRDLPAEGRWLHLEQFRSTANVQSLSHSDEGTEML